MIYLTTILKTIFICSGLLGIGGVSYYYYSAEDYQVSSYEREQFSPISHKLSHHHAVQLPIKIQVDYSNVQVSAAQLIFIQQKLINRTTAYLSSALKVIPRSLKTVYSPKCGQYSIPNSLRASSQAFDLGVIVSVIRSNDDTWFMRGVSCELDSTTNRPILGTLEINFAKFNNVNVNTNINEEWDQWQQQALHEFIHLIAFNQVLYPYYINPQTNAKLGVDSVVRTFLGRKYIILPQVVTKVKKYFDCSQAIGGLLEDNGGDNVAGLHWEKVGYGNEIMTGNTMPDQVISEITLALLEGTGWYYPDYSYAQAYTWGLGEGCGMTTGSCSVAHDEFCSVSSNPVSGCTNDYQSISGCFSQDPLSPGCFYQREYLGGDCRFRSQITDQSYNIGGAVGPGARCFTTSLPQAAKQVGYKSACFTSVCKSNKSIQFIVGSQIYNCENEGQIVMVKYQNMIGSVTCPNIANFCTTYQKCPNECSGNGICHGLSCGCFSGYTGLDCSNKLN